MNKHLEMPRFKNCSTFPLRGFKEREVGRMKSHLKSYHRNCGHWSPLIEESKGFLSVSFMSTLGISVPHTVSHSCSQNPKRRLRNDNESAFRIPRPATVIRRSGLASLPRSARTDWQLASGHLCYACDDMRHPCQRAGGRTACTN